ncbi:MAG: C_GCAxxG_C_C family protein [Spirochaetales bacterium]|nr:C_GCAxxG_C_C family protein [Spirochaetales bacterium]
MKTMNPVEEATILFSQGYNCAQAVLISFCENFALEREQAIRLAAAFGGGVSLQNSICGAVSGALMVIGLSCEKDKDIAALKKISREKATDFIKQFKNTFGSINCTELLGYDLSNKAEYQLATEKGLFKTRCVDLVRRAAEILNQSLNKE